MPINPESGIGVDRHNQLLEMATSLLFKACNSHPLKVELVTKLVEREAEIFSFASIFKSLQDADLLGTENIKIVLNYEDSVLLEKIAYWIEELSEKKLLSTAVLDTVIRCSSNNENLDQVEQLVQGSFKEQFSTQIDEVIKCSAAHKKTGVSQKKHKEYARKGLDLIQVAFLITQIEPDQELVRKFIGSSNIVLIVNLLDILNKHSLLDLKELKNILHYNKKSPSLEKINCWAGQLSGSKLLNRKSWNLITSVPKELEDSFSLLLKNLSKPAAFADQLYALLASLNVLTDKAASDKKARTSAELEGSLEGDYEEGSSSEMLGHQVSRSSSSLAQAPVTNLEATFVELLFLWLKHIIYEDQRLFKCVYHPYMQLVDRYAPLNPRENDNILDPILLQPIEGDKRALSLTNGQKFINESLSGFWKNRRPGALFIDPLTREPLLQPDVEKIMQGHITHLLDVKGIVFSDSHIKTIADDIRYRKFDTSRFGIFGAICFLYQHKILTQIVFDWVINQSSATEVVKYIRDIDLFNKIKVNLSNWFEAFIKQYENTDLVLVKGVLSVVNEFKPCDDQCINGIIQHENPNSMFKTLEHFYQHDFRLGEFDTQRLINAIAYPHPYQVIFLAKSVTKMIGKNTKFARVLIRNFFDYPEIYAVASCLYENNLINQNVITLITSNPLLHWFGKSDGEQLQTFKLMKEHDLLTEKNLLYYLEQQSAKYRFIVGKPDPDEMQEHTLYVYKDFDQTICFKTKTEAGSVAQEQQLSINDLGGCVRRQDVLNIFTCQSMGRPFQSIQFDGDGRITHHKYYVSYAHLCKKIREKFGYDMLTFEQDASIRQLILNGNFNQSTFNAVFEDEERKKEKHIERASSSRHTQFGYDASNDLNMLKTWFAVLFDADISVEWRLAPRREVILQFNGCALDEAQLNEYVKSLPEELVHTVFKKDRVSVFSGSDKRFCRPHISVKVDDFNDFLQQVREVYESCDHEEKRRSMSLQSHV